LGWIDATNDDIFTNVSGAQRELLKYYTRGTSKLVNDQDIWLSNNILPSMGAFQLRIPYLDCGLE